MIDITAVMTAHNRRDLTLRCLSSYFDQQSADFELSAVLVDDGSTDGTRDEVARRFGDRVKLIHGDGSLFWAAGMAEAHRHATIHSPDYLLWLNDDVELFPGALAGLVSVAADHPQAVVVGALSEPDRKSVSYSGVRRVDWHPMRFQTVEPCGSPILADSMHGNVVLVPKDIYVKHAIDGAYQHAYADYDYGLRVRRAGFEVLVGPEFVGVCASNSEENTFMDPALATGSRLRGLADVKGRPLRSQVRYLRRHGGRFWPLFVLSPYLRVLSEAFGRRRGAR